MTNTQFAWGRCAKWGIAFSGLSMLLACGSDVSVGPVVVSSVPASVSSVSSVVVSSSSSSVVASSSSVSVVSSSVSSGVTSSSAGTPTGPLSCAEGIICENFESPLNADWTNSAGRGTIARSQEQNFGEGGAYSLKVTGVDNSFNQAFITVDLSNYTAIDTMMWGRMMVYLQPRQSATNAGDFTFVTAQGKPKSSSTISDPDTDVMYRYRLADSNGRNGTVFGNYETFVDKNGDNVSDVLTDCFAHGTSTPLPTDTWACVEWHYDTGMNQLTYWLDDAQVVSVNSTGEGCAGGDALGGVWEGPETFNQLRLGIEQYAPSEARVMYLDDILVNNTGRVGCPPAPEPEPDPEAITDEERAQRIAAGKILYEGGATANFMCSFCHGDAGVGDSLGGSLIAGMPFSSANNANCERCETGTYSQIVDVLINGVPGMSACAPIGCAEPLADYIWGELNGLTLTRSGGTRP